MFNKSTIELLTQVNAITNSVILKYPQTVAISDSRDIQVVFDISEVDADVFSDIGLKDSLSDFLNAVKLFSDERDIDVDGNKIQISSGKQSMTYITDNIVLMDAYDITPEQMEKTVNAPSVCSFDLDDSDMKQLKSASNVFKDLSEVVIKSQDDDVDVFLAATNKFNQHSNTFTVSKPSDTTKEFEIKLPVENFKLLPVSNYTVDVKYNSAKDTYRVILTNKSLSSFKIMLAVKA